MNTKHAKLAKQFIENEAHTNWHNQTLWYVREKRDRITKEIEEWENLREMASQIKMHTISHLDHYLKQFAENAEKNGAIVHFAKDADEHNQIIQKLFAERNVKKVAKSKSMLTEECELNDYLNKYKIDVIESDLGERILQLNGTAPSHIVLPAIHMKRQEVGKLFEEKLNTEKENSDPTYLTHTARNHLRDVFLTADAAITGCNFGVAETGDVVVCTNEGNADMGTSLTKLHVVSMGLEKVIPNHKTLGFFTRLLARSATGQPSTTYTSHFRKPISGGEFHIIIVDNGRSDILNNESHIQTLKCIRCAACMNTCPVYRRTGGYSYSYFIPGPIGINLGMLKSPKKHAGNLSACSLCYSCNNVCPVKIDLADQIYRFRQESNDYKQMNSTKKYIIFGLNFLFKHPKIYNVGTKMATVAEYLPRFVLYNRFNSWGVKRELPKIAQESFTTMWKKGKVQEK